MSFYDAGQALDLHVDKGEAGLEIHDILRKHGLLHAQFDRIAIRGRMVGYAITHIRFAPIQHQCILTRLCLLQALGEIDIASLITGCAIVGNV